jgi:hypothetical protein
MNEKSFSKAMKRIHSISRTPQRYLTSTSIEAVATASYSALGQMTPAEAQAKYGSEISLDSIAADELRINLHSIILRAWRKRRRVTTSVVNPLSCYDEIDPVEERGLIVVTPRGCIPGSTCVLARQFREKQKEVEALKAALEASGGTGREHQKRYQALRELTRKSGPFDHEKCRALGDAVFALLAPEDATILTTNLKDHKPLAEALGKSVVAP